MYTSYVSHVVVVSRQVISSALLGPDYGDHEPSKTVVIGQILDFEHNKLMGNIISYGWLRKLSKLILPRPTSPHGLRIAYNKLENLMNRCSPVVSVIFLVRLDEMLALAFYDLSQSSCNQYLNVVYPEEVLSTTAFVVGYLP